MGHVGKNATKSNAGKRRVKTASVGNQRLLGDISAEGIGAPGTGLAQHEKKPPR